MIHDSQIFLPPVAADFRQYVLGRQVSANKNT